MWKQWSVRFLLVIPMLLLSGSLVTAQETEKRIQTILHPDRNAASGLGGKTFYGGSVFQPGSGSANGKSFNYTEHYSPQSFGTKSYSNSTPYSTEKFATHPGNIKNRYDIQGVEKKVETKTSPTKEAGGIDKNYASTNYSTRDFRERGKSQDSMDLKKQDTKPMTIDQVRELLDKNK